MGAERLAKAVVVQMWSDTGSIRTPLELVRNAISQALPQAHRI